LKLKGTGMGKLLSRALVIHPGALVRTGISTILRRDLKVSDVVERDSALRLAQYLQANRDLLLLVIDPDTEGCDGFAGLARLRRTCPWLRIAVISEANHRHAMLEALSAGAQGFVSSNSPLDEIVRTFMAALEGHVHVPDAIADLTEETAHQGRSSSKYRFSDLTPRQRDVAKLVVQGRSNKAIARSLGISESTVKVHMSSIFRYLGVVNRVGVVAALDDARLVSRTPPMGALLGEQSFLPL
jgi:DNA-binding NarL/FixJ family response regulator